VLASGIVAGAAAVLSLAAFDAADAPSGRTPWPEIGVAIALAAAVAYALVRVRDDRRIVVAGVVGACAAVANIGSLGIFRHGVVISLLPAVAARSAAAVAVSFGVAALLMLMSRTPITKGR
jgi:predicted permease